MALFLNLASSGIMVLFLLLLVWRGCWQLGWLPQKLACPFAPVPLQMKPHKQGRQGDVSKQTIPAFNPSTPCGVLEAIFWFCAAIVLSWLFFWLGFCLSGQADYHQFLPYAWQRLTTAGDSPHYQYLAEFGYATAGEKINLIVFYPLYPVCIAALRVVLGGNTLLAGVLFSHVCWGMCAVCLRRLAGRLYAAPAARAATLAMMLFPFSFFSLGVFTESLFLLLTILALDATVQQRFGRAGMLGLLAALCRTQGVVLVIGAVYAFLHGQRGKNPVKAWRTALPIALIPLGYLGYLALNWYICGKPLAFLYYQSIAPWYQHVDWVGNNIAQQWGMAVAYPGLAPYIYYPEIALYFVVMVLLIYGVLAGAPMPFLLYGGAYIGASYLAGWLISGGRYVFGCAAIYLLVGYLKPRAVRWCVLAMEAAFLLYYACCYMQGQAIM